MVHKLFKTYEDQIRIKTHLLDYEKNQENGISLRVARITSERAFLLQFDFSKLWRKSGVKIKKISEPSQDLLEYANSRNRFNNGSVTVSWKCFKNVEKNSS